ncbi:MAG: helix-turn-helix domain-containing protein [Candidatus Coproplasma sp.]
MSFADNLQYLRKKNKITQEELAEELNLSRQSISKWETGEAYPETDKLILLCDKFGVTLDELLRGDVTKEDVTKEDVTGQEDKDEEVVFEKAEDGQSGKCDGECGNSESCAGCNIHYHPKRDMHGHIHTKRTMAGAAISSSTMAICGIIYLCLGFCLGLWHPTWLIFIGGVIVCMWSGGMLEDTSNKPLKEKIGGLVCGTVMVGSLLIYLSIGFVCGIWHPTWVVFIIAAGVCGVVGPLTNGKKD